MNTYGWLLFGETLFALLALGLCGGWVLWPFRRDERPYLWVSSPLTGLFSLGGGMAVLYFFAGLPFRWCLWISLIGNVAGTLICLIRVRPSFPALSIRVVATVMILAAAYWATVSCNHTSITAREPTVTAMDGSDMFGYAIVSDWMREHRASAGPQKETLVDCLTYCNLRRECSRPVTFLLMAAASEFHATSGLFAYDWAIGVLLATGLLGFAGAYGRNALIFALLVVGTAAASWLTNARTGYMGKSVGYPGGLLLVELLLTTLIAPSRARYFVVVVFGAVLAWSLSPTFPPVLMAVLLGGYAVALVVLFARNRWDERPAGFYPAVVRPMLAALILTAAASLPSFAIHKIVFGTTDPPLPPTDWSWVIPVALDLEKPTLKTITPTTQTRLLYGCVLTLLVALIVAIWQRNRAAAALISCALIVPFAWVIGEYQLYSFHGLIYPLTLAGAAALAAPGYRRSDHHAPESTSESQSGLPLPASLWPTWGWVARSALVCVLIMVMIGLRVPQIRSSAARYVYQLPPHKVIHRLSEARALRDAIGPDGVDVALAHWADNHLAWTELATQGVPVRFRSPAWDCSLAAHAYSEAAQSYDMFGPKARYSLLERPVWTRPGTERWVGTRLKLVEDHNTVTIVGVIKPIQVLWDMEWRPHVWLGTTPTEVLIHNGTGGPAAVRFVAAVNAHPDRTDPRTTLRYQYGDDTHVLTFDKKEDVAVIPLSLQPGMNRVVLSVVQPAGANTAKPTPLLAFQNWRIEQTTADTRAARQ